MNDSTSTEVGNCSSVLSTASRGAGKQHDPTGELEPPSV